MQIVRDVDALDGGGRRAARRTAARSPSCRPWARSTPAIWRWSPRRGGAPTMSSPRSSSIRPSSAPTRISPPIRAARRPTRRCSRRQGCAILWAPDVATMYPDGSATDVRVGGVSEGLDGAARPGHFDGVATVVAQAVRPGPARRRPVRREGLSAARGDPADGRATSTSPVEIVGVPTQRDADGLALSSRNAYLSDEERARGAGAAARARRGGAGDRSAARDVAEALATARERLAEAGFDPIDYVELRDAETLAPLTALDRPARLLAAARIGRTRLIDNLPGRPGSRHASIAALTICWRSLRQTLPRQSEQGGMSDGSQSEIRGFPDRKPDRRRGDGATSRRSTSSASLIRPAPAASRSTSSKRTNGSTSPPSTAARAARNAAPTSPRR